MDNAWTPEWNHDLSPDPKRKDRKYMVNSVAIADDGSLVAAGLYYFPYPSHVEMVLETEGDYGTFIHDADGRELLRDTVSGNEGIYAVTMSGNAKVVASGGLLSGGLHAPGTKTKGLVRAFMSAGGTWSRTLNFSDLKQRVNALSLSHDGSVLAGVTIAGELFVFFGQPGFTSPPTFLLKNGPRLDMVCVHPSGKWLIASGADGRVHLYTLNHSAVGTHFSFQSPVRKNVKSKNGNIHPDNHRHLQLLACALARGGDSFVVAGQNELYLFSVKAATTSGTLAPIDHVQTEKGKTTDDIRWVAMSGDGSLVSVVQNDGDDKKGTLIRFSVDSNRLHKLSTSKLNHNPNSTSIDLAGRFITAADGHPLNTPGTFYLFRASDGTQLRAQPTVEMNWPMVVSADGKAACGGSDDGKLLYFTI